MSTALYRRYRPESFADVIGQDHVTGPLSQALRSGRVNHAYLFSGPRGCGKTTSARILARCLNCAEGPTPTPCGTCDSCRELARGGSGSLDVVEIDAASHGGVDDARELRERATMAPARDRFKVYVIDEAHMVSNQGFNALLKLVEEPPEHVKFVFATTEPDKVLQTIRSRTHHYSFRLVPPDTLVSYLSQLCESEEVTVGKGVLPLVVRAGAGSVRDSLSVLDQLIAGADADGVDYERAIALLGYTDSSMLDDIVSALGSGDGAALFHVVDRVVESGHDPKRFVEDLLERLRDLIVLQAMGEAAEGVLRAVPPDQMERMRTQSTYLGPADLSRAADVTNAALNEMVGASSPRMHLELLCARLLLPGADSGDRGLGARLDRIERRLAVGGQVAERAQSGPRAEPHSPPQTATAAAAAPQPPRRSTTETQPAPKQAPPPESPRHEPRQQETAQQEAPHHQAPHHQAPQHENPREQALAQPTPRPAADDVGAVDTEALRRMWPDVLRQVQGMRRSTWMIISANAQVHRLADGVLELAFSNQGTARGFAAGQHPEVVAAAVSELLGVTVRVQAAPEAAADTAQPPSPEPPVSDGWDEVAPTGEAGGPPPERPGPPPGRPPVDAPRDDDRRSEPSGTPGGDPDEHRESRASRMSRAEQVSRPPTTVAPEDDTVSDDDPDAEDSGMVGPSVVEELLGGRVIDAPPGR